MKKTEDYEGRHRTNKAAPLCHCGRGAVSAVKHAAYCGVAKEARRRLRLGKGGTRG